MELEEEFSLEIRYTGDVSLGTPDYWSSWHGNWLPGDPPEVTNFKAFLGDKDVTDDLPEYEIEKMKNNLIEAEEEEAA